jgi:hypothetical protein
VFGTAYLLLDRYFLSVPALQELKEHNTSDAPHVDIITKAKTLVSGTENFVCLSV